MMIFWALALLLILPAICHAKGGGSSTVDAVGPKSENLLNLENMFYQTVTPLITAYSGVQPPVAETAAATPAAAAAGQKSKSVSDLAKAKFGLKGTQPAAASAASQPSAVSNGKGGSGGGGSTMYLNPDGSVSTGKGAGGTVIPQPYDSSSLMGQLFNDATKKTYVSNQRYDNLLGQAQGLSDKSLGALSSADKLLGQAPTAGDWWYDQAKGAYDQASGLLGQSADSLKYASETDKWYSDYAKGALGNAQNLLNTGDIPAPLLNALQSAVQSGLDKSMGSSLNDLASRGVVNSSVTNKGLADMSQAAGDALNRGYLDAFNSVLGGYTQTADTAANAGRAFTDSFLDINSGLNSSLSNAIGLGDSYANTGSMKVSDMLNSAAGYGNLSQGYLENMGMNLQERDQLLGAVPQYYTNAAAPMMPAYDFLQTMLNDHWNSDQKDTIVKQGK
jgi:hypothetical protein